jgi:hypothetical protein
MGEWTFKDLAAHLTAWRRRTVSRLEAAARGERDAPPPWPSELIGGEDDPINAWIHDQSKDRQAAEVLRESDAVYDDLVAAVQAFPIAALDNPGRFPWLEGAALGDFDPGVHLADHEPDVRRWLAER